MIYYLILILVLANQVFWLIPGGKIAGVIKPEDIGLLLLIAGVVWSLKRPHVLTKLSDPIAISFMVLLIFLAIQASMASFNFGQPIINGMVAIREQYYYLSFFVFLAVLDSEENIKRFLNVVSLLAIVVSAIAILDYLLGPSGNIYKSKFSGGSGIRFGVERATVAGMDIITLALIWQISKLTAKKSRDYSAAKFGVTAVFLLGMHFFRMTRSRLVALTIVLGWILFKSRQIKLLVSLVVLLAVTAIVADVTLKKNVILAPFISTAEVLQDHTGAQIGRLKQMEKDFEVFLDDPILGSGSAALRASKASSTDVSAVEAAQIARKVDLGYTHWLKAYGLLGVFWLIWFYLLMWLRLKRILKKSDKDKSPVAIFMLGYFYFIVISFITLNHFMLSHRIIFICALAAMAVNLRYLSMRKTTPGCEELL